jgi:hypothetical protein
MKSIIIIILISIIFASTAAAGDNPNLALGISICPGFILHGASHIYIGEWKVGAGLLVLEIVGIYIGTSTSIINALSEDSEDDILNPWRTTARVLVWGTWAYDIIAPQIKLRKEKRTSVNLIPIPSGVKVGLNIRF